MQQPADTRRGIVIYLLLAFGLSSIFYTLIIHAGTIGAQGGMYVTGLMWSPAVGALLTCRLIGRSISTLGWEWKPRYQVISYLIPIGYAFAAYLAVWLSGFGGFPNHDFLDKIAASGKWTGAPAGVVLAGYVVLRGTTGMVISTATALGEEIGWRGFLVPQLAKISSFTTTALVSGVIWTAWHVPLLLFADYNGGTPHWYSLTCFAVMVIGISFVFAWMRLRSGSLWTGAVLHASHNMFIQTILTPMTTDTGRTKWAIDEFGAALPIAAVIAAILVWRRRGAVEGSLKTGVS
jgi:membrane protease YdiL (CAAX protease family)